MLHYLQGLLSALDLTSLLDAVLRVAAIFLCLTVHETCHGLAALALGDPTAKSMHRLSLNPLRQLCCASPCTSCPTALWLGDWEIPRPKMPGG